METKNIILHFFIFSVFFLASWMAKKGKFNRLINDDGTLTENLLNLILFQLFGIFLLGYLPIFFIDSEINKALIVNSISNKLFIFSYTIIFLLLLFFATKQAKKDYSNRIEKSTNLVHYSYDLLSSYFVIRALFLTVYELWFRGLLLSDCITSFGVVTAISINLFLYVSIHILNGKKEMLACIPFGLLTCTLSIVFNNVWLAVLLHLGFSLFYEITFYKLNSNHFKTISS